MCQIMNGVKSHTYQVIIIGAGVSGLSAARTLIQNGVENILILEATEKVGGRISSQHCGDSFVELGAQWIHGEENELFDLIQRSGNLHDGSSWEGKGDFLTPSGDSLQQNIVTDVLDWLETSLGDVEDNFSIETFQDHTDKWPKDISMGYYLRKEFQQYLKGCAEADMDELKNAVFQWAMSFQRIDNSCNRMSDLSLFRWSEYKSNGQHVYRNFRRGAQYFIDEILVNSSLQSKIRLNSPVESIDWTEDITKLYMKSGEHFQCHSTLITCSAGVLKATKNEMFIPPLPSTLSSAISATGFGPAAKIFLEWTEPWWPSDFLGIQLVWPNEYINCCDSDNRDTTSDLSKAWYKAITGFDPVLDNPHVLLAWLGGPESVYVEGISKSEVGLTCAKLLRQFTKNANIQEPMAVQVSNWNSNPYFRGAYSYRSKDADRCPGDITSVLIEPVYKNAKENPVLIFAGEALHPEYYSTLHGAFESGQSQAEKLVQCFKRNC